LARQTHPRARSRTASSLARPCAFVRDRRRRHSRLHRDRPRRV